MKNFLSLKLRVIAFIKRAIIRKMGCISDQRYYLDSYMMSARSDVARLAIYSNPLDYPVLLPATNETLVHSMRSRYTYCIENGYVDAISSCIYDRHGRLIAESSSWALLRHLYDWPMPNTSSRQSRLIGSYILMPVSGYYHWLIEDLPVFLASLLICPKAIILCRLDPPSYVNNFLSSLPNQIYWIKGVRKVEKLIMTGKVCGTGSPCGGLAPHPTDINLLRNHFRHHLEDDIQSFKIYLTRLGSKRSPKNEVLLQDIFRDHGFLIFDGVAMTFLDQIKLFSRASCIVGFHGAAFSNVVWCAPKSTLVYEIFNSSYIPYCYAAISQTLNLNYQSYVIPESMPGDAVSAHHIRNILNDISYLI